MRFASYEGEKDLRTLASRLFGLSGAKSDVRAGEAEAALRQANPHLDDLTKVPAGTAVIVPDVPGLAPAGGSGRLGVDVEVLMGAVQASLGAAGAALEEGVHQRDEEAKRELALLRSKEVKDLAATDQAVAARVEHLIDANQRVRKETKALRTEQAAGLQQLAADLQEFLELHGGG